MKFSPVFISLFLLLFCFIQTKATENSKPNFVFILTDDHSYNQLGCTGNTIVQTPNIDKLAEKGTLFTNAHITSAICTPSRVSILLSQYERKHGVNFNSGTSVSDKAWENSYPVVMRKAGYYTGYVGKNHSPVGKGGYESGLMEESFDYWYGGHKHLRFYPKKHHKIFKGAKSNTQVEILNEGVQDFLSNEHQLEGAKHFLDNRPENRPFCLSLCFNVPHGASTGTMEMLESDPELYKTKYRDVEIPMPINYVEKDKIKEPKLPESIHHFKDRQTGYNWVDTKERVKERKIRQMQTITGVDRLIGELLETLKKKKLDKRTIIIFSSDHGLFSGEFGLGGKALCYEVCTHVPLVIYNPMVKRSARGQVCNELVQSIDVAPTMLAYAGIEIPNAFQGKALNGIIDGELAPVREYLFTENLWSTHFGNPRCESVQDKEWKYIRYYQNNNQSALKTIALAKQLGIKVNEMLYGVHDPQIAVYRSFVEAPFEGEEPVYEELYHLAKDPDEINNLAKDSDKKAIMDKMRKAWKFEVAMARGKENPQVYRYTVDGKKDVVKPE